MNWYLKVWQQYADFSTRARRQEYWMFVLINFLIVMGLYIVSFLLLMTESSLAFLMTGIILIYGLATLIPSLAVAARRLHDTGKSGLWLLISLIPLIGAIILLVFLLTDSQPGDNKWGPNPKQIVV